MKWNILSSGLVLGACLALASPVEARTRRRSRFQKKTEEKKPDSEIGKGPGYGLEQTPTYTGYTAPARINCDGGWDMFVSGSFVYWLVGQQQMDLGAWSTVESTAVTTANPATTSVIEQKMAFKPGFKVAVGTTFNHDDWMGQAEYTRLHMSTKVTSAPPQPAGELEASLGWVQSDSTHGLDAQGFIDLNQLRSTWTVNLDCVDVELGRWAYSGSKLSVNTFFGARGGYLKQKMRFTIETIAIPTTALHNRVQSKSWFIGPRGGIDTNWILGYGFRLTGNGAASLLYERSKVSGNYTTNDADDLLYKMRNKARPISPVLELGLGMGWGFYFCNNRSHFDITAAYELQYWFNQNAMRSEFYGNHIINFVHATPIKSGDLYLHGLTLSAKFDF